MDRLPRRDLLRSAVCAWVSARRSKKARGDRPDSPQAGAFRRIYDPDRGDGASWHVNDHAFIQGKDGLWHMFGIAWTDPGSRPSPTRGFLEHATSKTLDSTGWTRRPPVLELDAERGETVMWAPHVVEDRGTYHLFVATGGPDLTNWGITRTTSDDLFTWTRSPGGPVFRDGFQARDPMIFRLPDERKWVMYYCATDLAKGGHHVVAYRTSEDLIRWGERKIAFVDEHRGTDYGPTESPFVVFREGWYYLFIGPRPYDRPTKETPNYRHPGYDGTDVFASRDWKSFANDQKVGDLKAHAAEVIEDRGGKWLVSHAGVERKGLYLATLSWTAAD